MSLILDFEGKTPQLGRGVWVAPGAVVLGDVVMGEDCNVWYNAVIRGDVFHIRIGARTNIQDLAMLHVTTDRFATIIGDDVTVGHKAMLHGCTIGNNCLIGMNAVVLDEVVIGENCLVAAGSVVTPRTIVPPNSVVMGNPAVVRRPVTPEEIAGFQRSAHHYVRVARRHQGQPHD